MVASLLTLGACERAPEPQYLAGPTMGTTYHVTVTALPGHVTRAQVQGVIDDELAEVDARLSTWRADSEISRFNASNSLGWTPVSRDLLVVLEAARRVSSESGGAFDVTVAPLVDLWGFGREVSDSDVAPTEEQLRQARAEVGFELLEVRETPPAVGKRRPGVRADVAGIAPGYAVDRIAERLRGLHVEDALVEIGGEVRAWGRNPDGARWRVAIEAPVAGERRAYALAELDDMSISTSGDYRDFHIVGGRRVSHTIDPRTGFPVAADLASVTVLHGSAMMADAYATALMVMGPESGMRFAELHGLAALFLVRVPGASGWHERVTPQFTRLRRPLP
jgi:thiamine biosynthesis lipoprotein